MTAQTDSDDSGREYPQESGRGAKITVSKDRLANETDESYVFFTDTAEAERVAGQALRGIAIEKLRGELGREPEEHEIQSRVASIADQLGREARRFL